MHGLQANMFHQRRRLLDHLEIRFLENYFLAGALAARLLAGLLRPADDRAFAERVEAVDQDRRKLLP